MKGEGMRESAPMLEFVVGDPTSAEANGGPALARSTGVRLPRVKRNSGSGGAP
jgi:hypothetical protein